MSSTPTGAKAAGPTARATSSQPTKRAPWSASFPITRSRTGPSQARPGTTLIGDPGGPTTRPPSTRP